MGNLNFNQARRCLGGGEGPSLSYEASLTTGQPYAPNPSDLTPLEKEAQIAKRQYNSERGNLNEETHKELNKRFAQMPQLRKE